jgi:hypothetical protein
MSNPLNNKQRMANKTAYQKLNQVIPAQLPILDKRYPKSVEDKAWLVVKRYRQAYRNSRGTDWNVSSKVVNYLYQVFAALAEANLTRATDEQLSNQDAKRFFVDFDFRHSVLESVLNPSIKEMYDKDNGPYEMVSDRQRLEFMAPVLEILDAVK